MAKRIKKAYQEAPNEHLKEIQHLLNQAIKQGLMKKNNVNA
jgi:ribosomal protein S20